MNNSEKKVKMNVLKRMVGKRVFVVTNTLTEEGYCGVVNKVIDHETLGIISDKTELNVSIFDVRTPSKMYNCE